MHIKGNWSKVVLNPILKVWLQFVINICRSTWEVTGELWLWASVQHGGSSVMVWSFISAGLLEIL